MIVKASLRPDEMVTDQILRDLAKPEPCQQVGVFSLTRQAILTMYLPEIAGELLAYRLSERMQRDLSEETTG